MQAFEQYVNIQPAFWAFVKIVSEQIGYSKKNSDSIRSYTVEEIKDFCCREKIVASDQEISLMVEYSCYRADLLNNFVKPNLMDAAEAERQFEKLSRLGTYYCKIPINKQAGLMQRPNYFTGIINMITESTLNRVTGRADILFDDDPRGLIRFFDNSRQVIGASSRRFDGALPSISDPFAVWEIKEYYYATTFGSRVADGVYETQLDGYEFRELFSRTGRPVFHCLFIDGYQTWWEKGKSYLCRIIDALNQGIVDEVIAGKEVLNRWPQIVEWMANEVYNQRN